MFGGRFCLSRSSAEAGLIGAYYNVHWTMVEGIEEMDAQKSKVVVT